MVRVALLVLLGGLVALVEAAGLRARPDILAATAESVAEGGAAELPEETGGSALAAEPGQQAALAG